MKLLFLITLDRKNIVLKVSTKIISHKIFNHGEVASEGTLVEH